MDARYGVLSSGSTTAKRRFVTQGSWTDFISVAAIVIVVLSPLLCRIYIQCFWIRGRGTVIRLEGGINTNADAGGGWVWTPVIEYCVAGQRFSSQFSYWQRISINAKSKYAVGDGRWPMSISRKSLRGDRWRNCSPKDEARRIAANIAKLPELSCVPLKSMHGASKAQWPICNIQNFGHAATDLPLHAHNSR
jgi:hypothetical protein